MRLVNNYEESVAQWQRGHLGPRRALTYLPPPWLSRCCSNILARLARR